MPPVTFTMPVLNVSWPTRWELLPPPMDMLPVFNVYVPIATVLKTLLPGAVMVKLAIEFAGETFNVTVNPPEITTMSPEKLAPGYDPQPEPLLVVHMAAFQFPLLFDVKVQEVA